MDPAVKAWIESTSLSAEAKAALLGDAAFENVYKDNILTRSDYSRKMNTMKDDLLREMQTEKDAIETERKNVEALRDQNVTWKSTEEGRLNAAIARGQAAEGRLLKLQQTLRDKFEISEAYMKELELDKDPLTTLPPIEDKTKGVQDTGGPKYLTPEELNKRDLANLAIANQLRTAEREHLKLFGNLDDFDENAIVQHGLQNKHTSIKQAWEDKYGVAAKREAITTAAWEKKVEDAKTQARMEALSEAELRSQQNISSITGTEGPFGKGPFKRVVESTKDVSSELGSQAAHRSRVERALAVSADVRSGKIPTIPIATQD